MRTMVYRAGDTISVPDVDIVTDECDHESQEDRSVTEQGTAYAQRLSPPMRAAWLVPGSPHEAEADMASGARRRSRQGGNAWPIRTG